MSNDKPNIKGYDLRPGDIVTMRLWWEGYASTEITGTVTGVQFWNPELIAIQIAGLTDWIRLTDTVEIGKYNG